MDLGRLGRRAASWLAEKAFSPARFEKILIEDETITDVCALARSAAPKEMIAFLTGEVKREGGEQVLLINGLYVKGYHASEESTFFTLHDLPLTSVYGTVHSHPLPDNRPSSADKLLFNKHGWFHLIISAPYRPEDILAYDKYGRLITFSIVRSRGGARNGVEGSPR